MISIAYSKTRYKSLPGFINILYEVWIKTATNPIRKKKMASFFLSNNKIQARTEENTAIANAAVTQAGKLKMISNCSSECINLKRSV